MDDKTRLQKLSQAEYIIREVEFSYPQSNDMRRRLYAVVVNTFGMGGSLYSIIESLKQSNRELKMYSSINFDELSINDQHKAIKLASDWYDEHLSHVSKLIDGATAAYQPSGSDLFHPELWKDSHWLWAFNLGWLDL